jgi:hypothetical protein
MQQLEGLLAALAANLAGQEARLLPIELGILAVALSIAVVRRLILETAAILLLGLASLVLMVAPASAPTILMLAGVLGSLLIAVAGVVARRRRAVIELQLNNVESRLVRTRTELECLLMRRSTSARHRRNGDAGQACLAAPSDKPPGAKMPLCQGSDVGDQSGAIR